MKMIITARRLVKSQRNDMSDKAGNIAAMTCGIVSPTTMQKASIPPNALGGIPLEQGLRVNQMPAYNAH